MAAAFLGGLGNFATSLMKGYEQAEDREAQLKQRQFEEGQRQRKLDEQRRADELRAADASVQTTEDVEVPGTKTIYGKEAPVVRDDDGNLMPGAVETPATTATRKRSWDAIMRDYATNRRKSGDVAGAMEFETKADKIAFDRASKMFTELSSKADSMTLPQLAKSYAEVFHNDPFGGKVDAVDVNPDGSVTIKTSNKETGVNKTATYKSKAELTSSLMGYYQPETFAKIQQSKLDAAIKAQEEASKPRTLRPGERLMMPNGKGGYTSVAENPTDRVQIGEDADGNPIYGKPSKYLRGVGQGGGDGDGGDGSGSGKKGKGKSPADLATSAIMDAVKESAESKSLNADQLIGVQATARELVASAERSGRQLDPYVAGKIALTAVLKPESVKPAYNQATGEFESTVSYNGNTFSVGRLDPSSLPESQVKAVAQSFASKLPAASRAEYIRAASGDREAVAKINSDIAAAHGKEWEAAFRAAAGRAPTAQERQASIARTQAIVGQNIDLVRQSGAVERDAKDREKAQSAQQRAAAQQEIGTPEQIMALPRGKAAEIYRQYEKFTTGPQREALQMKMAQDRRSISMVGGIRPQQ